MKVEKASFTRPYIPNHFEPSVRRLLPEGPCFECCSLFPFSLFLSLYLSLSLFVSPLNYPRAELVSDGRANVF